jgi:hypothetical protein
MTGLPGVDRRQRGDWKLRRAFARDQAALSSGVPPAAMALAALSLIIVGQY